MKRRDKLRFSVAAFQTERHRSVSVLADNGWTSLLNAVFGRTRRVNSNLKIQTSEAITLIEKMKAELKKRAELKAKRMLLKVPRQREEPGQ